MRKTISNLLKNQTFIYIGAIILTLVGLYLRADHRLGTPLSDDELYAIGSIARYDSFFTFVSKLPHLEFSSYLTGDYYLLYPFVKIFGKNIWGIAIPHIISTILCFYFLFKVCQLHLSNAVGFFIAFALVTFNNTLIYHSYELRYYAVMQTLGLAAYYYTHLLVYRSEDLSKLKRIGIGAFFCLAILFHFYSVIMISTIIAFFLVIHIQDKSLINTARKMAPLFAIVFLITGPILYFVLFVWFHLSSGIWGNEPFRFIPNPFNDLTGFLKGVFCNLLGDKKLYFLFAGLIIALCLPHKDREKQFWFFLILTILPITLLLILDLKGGYWFIQRQFIWIMPLFAVLLGWCWESILSQIKQKWLK